MPEPVGPSDRFDRHDIRSGGEWLRFLTRAQADEYRQQWDTASACYPEWEPATVFPESEVKYEVR